MQIDQALTDKMVERGIAECAEMHYAGDIRRVRHALLMGNCEHCKCLSNSLVKQISEYIGQVDSLVKAVYQYEPGGLPESRAAEEAATKVHTGIHLIVWVERKSAALSALAETLKVVLASSQRALGCPNVTPDCYTLDIEVVDDRDVCEYRGFGLLIKNPTLRSQFVWGRTGKAEALPVEEPGRVRFSLPDSFDPEFIPEARLIEHALTIERLPPEDRMDLEHHLTQLKVTLIRRIISDQLRYIHIAKQWFTIADLASIFEHRIGFGRIGGKSAGMLLAGRILTEVAGEEIKACFSVPQSFFLGSDLMYIFMAMNGMMHWSDQKYKPEDQIRADYARIKKEFVSGEFPPEILIELQATLEQIGPHPIIVRSSSQLEDNLGTSFAGKYDSYFCPNQGNPRENLQGLTRAIASTYASTFKPDALLYRRSRGLQDYDERMAVLIQTVQGEELGRYYLPFAAGVAYSRNLFRWAPRIRREDGFARLVWGLGTRAVERVGNDYPRLVALSHPTLQPDDSSDAILHYSQRYVDVIDLEENCLKTLPIHAVLSADYAPIRYLVQLDQDGYLVAPRTRIMQSDLPRLAITFDSTLRRTSFAARLSEALRLLEKHFQSAVDVEFTMHIPDPDEAPEEVRISLLQCRPQSSFKAADDIHIPEGIPEDDVVFSSHFIVPQGFLPDIRYVIFVPPEKYFSLSSEAARNEVGRLIGRLNAVLEDKTFICVGPGRWGATNTDLGVFVGYADICHAGALVEISGKGIGEGPEPSLGTHFFQDLVEAQIYPIAVPLDDPETVFNHEFFYDTPDRLGEVLGLAGGQEEYLRLIEVDSFRPGYHLDLVLDDERGQAMAFLSPEPRPQPVSPLDSDAFLKGLSGLNRGTGD